MMENYGVELKVDDIDKFMGRAHVSGQREQQERLRQETEQRKEESTEPASTENKTTYIYQASDSNSNIYPGVKHYIRMGDDGMIKVKVVFLIISVSLLILSSILITKNVVNKKVK